MQTKTNQHFVKKCMYLQQKQNTTTLFLWWHFIILLIITYDFALATAKFAKKILFFKENNVAVAQQQT